MILQMRIGEKETCREHRGTQSTQGDGSVVFKDILASVISGKVSSVVEEFIENKKISSAVSSLIDKILGDFLKKYM